MNTLRREERGRETEEDLLGNRNLILSLLCVVVLSLTIFGDDTIRTMSQCPHRNSYKAIASNINTLDPLAPKLGSFQW